MVYLFVGCGELCLQIGLSVGWGSYVCKLFFQSVSWGLCLLLGLSVYYKFKPIPWILSYKWADYWPYLELFLSIFSVWPSVVMCITLGYLFHVWGGVGVLLVFLLFYLL